MGITSVAVAFVVLNAASLGTLGLVVAGAGVGATLAGIGLFKMVDDKQPKLGNTLSPAAI